jgi:hypothetical protein
MRRRSRSLFLGTLLSLTTGSAALIVPAAAFAATPAADTTTRSAACTEAGWPTTVQGRPLTFRSGARAGDYVWHDATGWHLRVTKPGHLRRIFTGKIVSDAQLTVAPYHLESGDTWTLSADKKTLTYRFATRGETDGIDFHAACATRLVVRGSMSGFRLPVGRIWTGRAGRHPLQNPFVIRRTV